MVNFTFKRAGHIFRNAPGHINPATLSSQQRYARLFENVASNPNNLNPTIVSPGGINAGVTGNSQIFRNGKQVWVQHRNGEIIDAGVNIPPNLR